MLSHVQPLLEVPSREEPSPISEDSEPLGLPHIGHLRVGESVNGPCLETLLRCCWDHDPGAAQ